MKIKNKNTSLEKNTSFIKIKNKNTSLEKNTSFIKIKNKKSFFKTAETRKNQ